MSNLLLDCTLRDGGYINNWDFGENAILDIINKLENSNVDIIEIGFLKKEEYKSNRTVYNKMQQISKQINPKKKNHLYAAMIEVVNPIPLEDLEPCSEKTVDIIRVIVWKRLLKEGFEYCKGIVEKGYKLCVQPARVDQYSYEEYRDMINLFNTLNPLAIYVVDSWGTQYREDILEYVKIADKYLRPEISIGYHGHNNLMQAFGIADAFLHYDTQRNKIIDASIAGIGRGAGNLNTELWAKYINEKHDNIYNLLPIVEIYEKYIKSLQEKYIWGYSQSYFLTAKYGCNPNYGNYYAEKGISLSKINEILQNLSDEDKIMFSKEKANNYLSKDY